MTGHRRGFNFYLVVLIGWVAAGCAHTKDPGDRLSTLLRVHLEATPHTAITKQKIYVYRAAPVEVEIEALYLLTEEHVVSARVVEEMGTYALEIRFNQWAIPLLAHNSSSYQGRRIALRAQFGPEQETVRWIGAPRLREVIDDGVLRFTPDATREEAYQIAVGLNNNARKVRKPLEW
jgi:hypothetical protein